MHFARYDHENVVKSLQNQILPWIADVIPLLNSDGVLAKCETLTKEMAEAAVGVLEDYCKNNSDKNAR